MASLVIKGAIFSGGKTAETSVRVENGEIVKVGAGDLGAADRVITLQPNETLLPGGVELLCAFRDWGEAERDTVETATKGALAAGVTTVCDQPNTLPRIMSGDKVRERAALAAEKAHTDFGISAAQPLDYSALDDIRKAGAFGLVLFPWDLRSWSYPIDTDDSRALYKRYADLGLSALIMVDEVALRETPLWNVGESYARDALLRRLDPAFKARLMITSVESVERINAAKDRLPNVAVTAAVHSVLISKDEAYQRIGSAAGHSPPLKSAEEVARMRALAEEGGIDIIVSHHAPHRVTDKYSAEPIPGEFVPKLGFSAIDYTYPLLMTKLGLAAAVRTYADAPARHLGVKKGQIAKGYDADFVIVEDVSSAKEMNLFLSGGAKPTVRKVDPSAFHSLGKVTPFVGERLKYCVSKTFLRGEEAYDAATGTFHRRAVRQIG